MKKISIFITLMTLIWFSCTRDTFEFTGFDCTAEVTYDNQLKDIIDLNCAYSGCHNGTPGVPGVYTSYQGMEADFDKMLDRVVDRVSDPNLGMPPDYATGPKDLTEDEFMLFSCWIAQEFPEN